MESKSRSLALWLLVILTSLVGGSCSSGAHSAASRLPELSPPTAPSASTAPGDQLYFAQAATCWNSMSCCIQNHPLTPVESCGADPLEAAKILKALEELDKAARTATLKGVDVPEREEGGEGEGEGEGTPEWKKKCMALYEECQEKRWRGNCGDCFRYCEGQRGTWPFKKCRER